MDKLVVRIYNVQFGDGILISVPDQDNTGKTETRHILIDVGNARSGEGSENEAFAPVIKDILEVLDGHSLDLYIMTHEHLDHVQGLLWAAKNDFPNLAERLNVQHAWFPNSSTPDYYDTHPEAKKKFDEAAKVFAAIERYFATSPESIPEVLEILLKINNRFLKASNEDISQLSTDELNFGYTAHCVEYLRRLASKDHTHYVYRSIGNGNNYFNITDTHNFNEVEFEIWAPEEDTADYYGHFQPMALGFTGDVAPDTLPGRADPVPPSGVDASVFYNLVGFRRQGFIDNLLAIDKAENNSSIVFCLKWRGWKLLFTGDAEIRSWKEMNKENVLSPIHFLKVSHHGSHNGTPDTDLLAKLLPTIPPPDNRPRRAAVSTFKNTYNGIPDSNTLDELKQKFRCTVQSTLDITQDEVALKIEFEDSV